MADAEIQVLLSLKDDLTAGLEKIEVAIQKSGDNIQKTQEKTTDSFAKQITTLQSLGNVAAGVDRIFSSYENLQLRLENAAERVANAQDRLADAQRKLNKLMADGTSSASDIATAQQEVERASRSLTISQNNQARAHNAVIGTYIDMGAQALSVASSISQLAKNIDIARYATILFEASTGELGLILAGIALVLGGLIISHQAAKQSTDEFTASQTELNTVLPYVTTGIDGQKNSLDLYIQSIILAKSGLKEMLEQEQKLKDFQDKYSQGVPGRGTSTNYIPPNMQTHNDFLMRPGQPAIAFSPDDTIIGMKNTGGMGTNIQIGAIYGLNPAEISKALKRELSTKMVI